MTTWTIGGGVDMFIGLNDTCTSCGIATVALYATVPGGPLCFNQHLDGLSTAKIGVNYRFW